MYIWHHQATVWEGPGPVEGILNLDSRSVFQFCYFRFLHWLSVTWATALTPQDFLASCSQAERSNGFLFVLLASFVGGGREEEQLKMWLRYLAAGRKSTNGWAPQNRGEVHEPRLWGMRSRTVSLGEPEIQLNCRFWEDSASLIDSYLYQRGSKAEVGKNIKIQFDWIQKYLNNYRALHIHFLRLRPHVGTSSQDWVCLHVRAHLICVHLRHEILCVQINYLKPEWVKKNISAEYWDNTCMTRCA